MPREASPCPREPAACRLEAALLGAAGLGGGRAAAPRRVAAAEASPRAREAALDKGALGCGSPPGESIWQPRAGGSLPGAWPQCWLAQYMAVAASAALCQEASPDALRLPDVLPSFHGAALSRGAAADDAPALCGCLAEEEVQRRLLIAQRVEDCLSDTHLRHDAPLHRLCSEAAEGWVSVDRVLSCPHMRALGATADDVRVALKERGSKVELKQECGNADASKNGIFVRRPDGSRPPALEPRPPAGHGSEPGCAADGSGHAGPELQAEAAGAPGWLGLGGAAPWACGPPGPGRDAGGAAAAVRAPPAAAAQGPTPRASELAVVLRLHEALQDPPARPSGAQVGAEILQLLKGGPGVEPTDPGRQPPPAAAAARPARGGDATPSTSASDRASDAGEGAGPTPRARGGPRPRGRRGRGGRGGRSQATPQKLPAAAGSPLGSSPSTPAKPVAGGRRAKNGELRAPKRMPASACQ